MKLKIRAKVLLGILFLFVEFVIIGVLSMYYISSIKHSSELTTKNNLWSVQYTENMVQAIDETLTATNSQFFNKQYRYDKNSLSLSFAKFEENLANEEKNITELGEKELVQSIRQKYEKYKSLISNQQIGSVNDNYEFYSLNILPLVNELKVQIFSVSTLNMHAIVQKNDNLKERVSHIYKILSIVLTLCFSITFSFMINFPNYIAEPIKRITEGIKEIANSNFKNRIQVTSNDEFGELAEAVNLMAEKLEENYHPVDLPKQTMGNETNIDENEILQNIQSLLESIRPLLESISKEKNNEILQKQSAIIKGIEFELSKVIE